VVVALGSCATNAASDPPRPSGGDSQGQHQPDATREHSEGEPAQTARGPAPPLVVEIQQPRDQNPIATETKDERRWYATPDWWVAGFTGALFVATAGLWIFTALMWRATKKAAEAAGQAAEALPVVERAYVYPEVVSAGAIDQVLMTAQSVKDPKRFAEAVGMTSDVTFVVKNFGKTPAILRALQVGFGLERATVEVLTNVPEPILGPGEKTNTLDITLWPRITPNDAVGVFSGSKKIVFIGTIVFNDIWGKSFRTDFRFDWDPQDHAMILQTVSVSPYLG
jgi:hypothetical protein